MAQAVIFPKLGQTMEEGAIVRWLKAEGETVAKGDILFEIETDKANLEVESFFEGVLIKILVREGITVPVNTVVGYVGAAGEKAPDAPAVAPPPAATKAPAPAPTSSAPAAATASAIAPAADIRAAPAPLAVPPPSAAAAAPARQAVSPRGRSLARAAAISTTPIRGTGPGGRVVEKDVRAYLDSRGYDRLRISPAAKRLAQEREIDVLSVRGTGDGGRIMVADIERAERRKPQPMPRMRQVIARRLTESKQTIPHFYVTVTADMTDLMAYRAELKAAGIGYSVNDFLLEAVVLALGEFPVVNSTTDGRSITWRGDVDLGVAVSVENGLVVPVVRAAQDLTLSELRDRTRGLAEKARQGRLTPDEMTGSSFTVSNMGMLDVENFSAIINPGEGAILAVASARPEPAVRGGQICVRTRMKMTLSADHRIIDGATAARFANAIVARLEDTNLWRSLV